jgi:hypothetical protein
MAGSFQSACRARTLDSSLASPDKRGVNGRKIAGQISKGTSKVSNKHEKTEAISPARLRKPANDLDATQRLIRDFSIRLIAYSGFRFVKSEL